VGTGIRKMITSVTIFIAEWLSQRPSLLIHLSVGDGFQNPDTGTQKNIVVKMPTIP
jgi:hypothetical protein